MSGYQCWCCQKKEPGCGCQDADVCRGCDRCEQHCACIVVQTEGAPPQPLAASVPLAALYAPPDLGIGPEAPIVINEAGGKQSGSPYSLVSSFPHRGVLEVARVIKKGLQKYEPDNWRLIPQIDHINHALAHVFAYCAGDQTDDHLQHAACRLLFALETK